MAKRSRETEQPTETQPEASASTPAVESITIQGFEFTAPAPYNEGHVLTAVEAGVLNQTFQENLRNNFAGRVKAAKEADALGEGNEGYVALNIDELRTEFAEYAAEYKFGVRRAGATVTRDPVMARAMVQARKIIKDAIKNQGLDLAAYKDQIDTLAENYLNGDGAPIVEAARESLAREQAAAQAATINLQLPSLAA